MAADRLNWYGKEYVAAKFVLWLLLTLATLGDALWHRRAQPKGFALHRCILAVVFFFTVHALLALAWGSAGEVEAEAAEAARGEK
jgi:hypothetical protein